MNKGRSMLAKSPGLHLVANAGGCPLHRVPVHNIDQDHQVRRAADWLGDKDAGEAALDTARPWKQHTFTNKHTDADGKTGERF